MNQAIDHLHLFIMDQENREVQVIIDQRGFQVQVVIDLMEAQEDLLPLPIMCQENQLVQT